MTDHAVIVPTSVGPAVAIVSEPAGAPRGTLIILQGDGPSGRSGVNAVWSQLARRLAAELGLTVLRFDYADEGDGAMIRGDLLPEAGHKKRVDLLMLRDVAAWLCERTGAEELLLIGDCHGGRLAIDLAGENPAVVGAFLSVPYVRKEFVALDERRKPIGWRRRLLGRVEPADFHDSVIAGLPAMLEKGPVWMLMGRGDGDEPLQLRRLFRSRGRPPIEVEVVRGMAVHPVTSPESQEEVSRRVFRRVAVAVEELSAARAPAPGQEGAASGREPAR